MTEVKEIFERVLGSAPAPRHSGAEVLAAARRSRRRARLATATAALGTVAVATGLGLALSALDSTGPGPTPPSAAERTGPTGAPPSAPPLGSGDGHGPRMLELLGDAVPAGYSTAPGDDIRFADIKADSPPDGTYVMMAWVNVSGPSGEVVLSAAVVTDGVPAPDTGFCGSPVAARLDWFTAATVTGCMVAGVGDVPVRVTTEQDPALGTVTRAVRFLDGGFVSVQLTPSVPDDGWLPEGIRPWWEGSGPSPPPWRGALPLTTAALAALAAEPALLPS